MDFGVGLATGVDAWKVAQRAEALGFSHAWFYDTQMLCADVFVAMTLAAANTSRIRLGTGVLIPSNRIAPVTANALASLNKLAPGRIDLGVGTGFTGGTPWGSAPCGWPTCGSTCAWYGRYWRARLSSGTFEGKRRKIRFLNPEAGLVALEPRIPVHLSAFGPRGKALAAEIADGWMSFVGRLSRGLREAREIADALRALAARPRPCRRPCSRWAALRAMASRRQSRARAQAGPAL